MEQKLIDFRNTEYQTAKHTANRRLKAWQTVQTEVEKLIELPSTKKQYDEMLLDPMAYVKQTLDDNHRPQFNGLPIKVDKILDMLEIDLQPLVLAITEMNTHKGTLTFTVGGGVAIVLNRKDYEVYTQNDEQVKQYNALQDFIDAAKKVFEDGKLPQFRTHHLVKFTNGRLQMEGGTLRPAPYHLKQI